MNDQAVNTLKTSRDGFALMRAALTLAQSADPADLDALHGFLITPEFLLRLDTEKAYTGTIGGLHLTRIMQTLGNNRARAAEQVLLKLTTDAGFNEEVLRMQLLVAALAPIQPSPPAAISYWDNASQPGSPIAIDVISALVINQSPPAMALMEKKFAAPQESSRQKLAWMRQLLLPRRNDQPLLAACDRMLRAGQPRGLQPQLVEALYDYKPDDWYRGCKPPTPPLRLAAPAPSRDLLRHIAEYALTTIPLPADISLATLAAYKELGGDTDKINILNPQP